MDQDGSERRGVKSSFVTPVHRRALEDAEHRCSAAVVDATARRDPFRRSLIGALAHQASPLLARWNRATSPRRTAEFSLSVGLLWNQLASSLSAFHPLRSSPIPMQHHPTSTRDPLHLGHVLFQASTLYTYVYVLWILRKLGHPCDSESLCCKRFHPRQRHNNTISIVKYSIFPLSYARVHLHFIFVYIFYIFVYIYSICVLLWPKR